MKISIIVLSYNKIELTKKCLASLKKNTLDGILVEIVVVDNASTDGSVDFLRSLKWIKLIENKENLGFSRANNQGAKESRGDILVFLNNDTEVRSGWLEGITEIFETEKNVGAVGIKLLFPDGKIQHAGLIISKDKVPRHIYYRENMDKPYVCGMREFQAVTAACIAVPKKVFEEVGGFDEGFKNGLEDVDLCLRIREKGYKIIYQPKSVVIHHESMSPGRFKGNLHNANLYMKKWGDKVIPDEHEKYREDGFGWLYILTQDLKNMAYSGDEYGTVPLHIKIMKVIYIPIQKTVTVVTLILKGDFKTLRQKTKKVLSFSAKDKASEGQGHE